MNAIVGESTLPEPIRIRGGLLDLNRRELIGPDQRRTALGRVESVLLGRLVHTPSEYVTPDELLALLWPDDESKSHNSVQSVVARVRRVLRNLPDGDKLVQTGYGRGYRFVPPRSAVLPPTVPATAASPDLDAIVELLASSPCAGLVHGPAVDVRAALGAALQRLERPPRTRFVDLTGALNTTDALQRIAVTLGADLRGLSLLRTQIKLVCEVLERAHDTLLVLLWPCAQVTAALEPLRTMAEDGGGLRLLVTSDAPIPRLMARHLALTPLEPGCGPVDVEADAARALVRCLRALDAGEYGQALRLVSDPQPTCRAAGIQIEILLARARAELALGLTQSALLHAEQALAVAQSTSLQPLRRRARGLRDALAPESSTAFLARAAETAAAQEGLRAVC